MVSPVFPERQAEIPAVCHMGTGRLQAIRREHNPLYYDVVHRFGQATGIPVLMNTSFNLRGEPIVASPADALNTFSKSDLDLLVMEGYVVRKGQPAPDGTKRKTIARDTRSSFVDKHESMELAGAV